MEYQRRKLVSCDPRWCAAGPRNLLPVASLTNFLFFMTHSLLNWCRGTGGHCERCLCFADTQFSLDLQRKG